MKGKSPLNQIRELLGMALKLASAKLDNGTTVEAEAFEAGNEIFVVTEEGEKVALPVGEYVMETGEMLVITEDGIIGEIKPKESEEPAANEEMADVVSREEFNQLKEVVAAILDKMSQEQPKEEMAKEEEKQEPVKAFKHSPEVEQKQVRFKSEGNTRKSRITNFLNTTLK